MKYLPAHFSDPLKSLCYPSCTSLQISLYFYAHFSPENYVFSIPISMVNTLLLVKISMSHLLSTILLIYKKNQKEKKKKKKIRQKKADNLFFFVS